jgi:hypothetical protein
VRRGDDESKTRIGDDGVIRIESRAETESVEGGVEGVGGVL